MFGSLGSFSSAVSTVENFEHGCVEKCEFTSSVAGENFLNVVSHDDGASNFEELIEAKHLSE